MFQLSRRPRTGLSAFSSALTWSCALTLGAALLGACSAPEADGDPEFDGIEGYGGPQNPTGSGVNNTPGQPTGQNSATNNGATNNGSTGNNTSPTPNTNPATTPNSETNPSPTPINTGTNTGTNAGTNTGGTNGGAMAPGAGGAGSGMGTTPPPNNGGNPTPPVTPVPPVVTPTPPVVTPSAPDIPCPSGAIFCSGFEGATLPAGATFEPGYLAANALGTEIVLDTAQAHSGRQSLKMPVGSNYYRMLVVPVPTSFWVRLYTRSNVGFGAENSTHASLYMGSTLPPGEYNGDAAVEIAEQFTQIQLNKNDNRYGTSGPNPGGGSIGTTLPNNTWTCMETQFDGATGAVRVFVEGDEIIDATGWQPPTAYKTFRFGYLRYDSPARDVWVDDVVVSTSRINCQ